MGNSWGNSGNSVRLYLLGLQIHCNGDCSHEIKRSLLLRRKVMANLDSIFNTIQYHIPFNITVIQVYVLTSNAKRLKLNGSMKTYKTF